MFQVVKCLINQKRTTLSLARLLSYRHLNTTAWPRLLCLEKYHLSNQQFNKNNNNGLELKSIRNYSAKKSKDKGGKNKPKVYLSTKELNSVINYDEFETDLNGILQHLIRDLSESLSLRITTDTIEQLSIKTSEGPKKLGELVQVEVKSPTSYTIDVITCPEQKKPIYDALVKSNLNLNPQINQNTIYLTLPKVTREHRENVAKSARSKCSQAIEKMKKLERNAERKANEAKGVSDDLIYNTIDHLKFKYEAFAKQASEFRDAKIKEILNE